MATRAEILIEFQQTVERVFRLPGSWYHGWDDCISNVSMAEMLLAGSGADFRFLESTTNQLGRYTPELMESPYTSHLEHEPNLDVLMVIRNFDTLVDNVRDYFSHDIRIHAFLLCAVYDVMDVVTLTDTQIRQALVIAAVRPGELSWDSLMSICTSGVDAELTAALVDGVVR
jgi:hypothetical protein